MPFRERVKRIFQSDQLSVNATTPLSRAHSQTTLEVSSAAVPITKTIPEQLWDEGYAQLKGKEPRLVQYYESINGQSDTPSVQGLTASLEDVEKLAKWRGKLKNIDYVLKLKSVVATGLQTSQEAVLAWTVVCTILEPLLNIGQEAIANQEGLQYIIERLEFNNKLSTLRLHAGRSSDAWEDLQVEIRLRIIALYMKILHYLIQSNIYHQQSAVKTYAKDSLKLYGWGKLLQDVKDAEAAVDKDDALRKAEANTANLQVLTNIVRSQEDRECLRQLRVTDPRDDKKRIETHKGGLLEDAYGWILDNDDYKRWRWRISNSNSSQRNNLLWIRGDPGKGKTMLLCGIIDELSKDNEILAFFFCQATDPRINSAENVVRGLLYMIAETDPTLKVLPILREKFDHAGAAAFNDANTWVVVRDLFVRVLEILSEQEIWLVVDALDECNQRDRLLDLIEDAPKHVKWLVSSRNWKDIEERLEFVLQGQSGLSLELNADSVTKAVDKFIDIKTSSLARLKRLDKKTTDSVREYLSANANDTFLWVALVCRSLSGKYCTRFNILELVRKFPQELDPMYRRIFEQIEDIYEVELVKRILSIVITVYRPLSVAELGHLLTDSPEDPEYLEYMINQSGFLTSQSSQVAFLHLSAKEFLLKSSELMIDGKTSPHQLIYERSMEILSTTLCRNPYAMAKVGCCVDDLVRPGHDPLTSIAYSCLYWTHHLLDLWATCSNVLARANNEKLLRHFYLKKYLYWIEALIWMESLPHGMHAMIDLKRIFAQSGLANIAHQPHLETADLHRDALRFILSSINVQRYPLQVYASVLYFSPTSSLIRKAFKSDMPSWLESKHGAEREWSRNAITLKLWNSARSFALSPDGQKLVIEGGPSSQIRNSVTGVLECELAAEWSKNAAFSADSRFVILAEEEGEIKKFDCSTGKLVNEVAIENAPPDPEYVCLASTLEGAYIVHSVNQFLHCRDTEWNLLREQYFEYDIRNLALSPDASRLAVITGEPRERVLHLYITRSGALLWRKDLSVWRVRGPVPIIFSVTGSNLIGADSETIYHWNTETGDEESRFIESTVFNSQYPRSLLFFGNHLYYSCWKNTIIKRVQSEEHALALREDYEIGSFAVTPYWLISLSDDRLRFYDIEQTMNFSPMQKSKIAIDSKPDISPNGKRVAYQLDNGMIRLWDMALSFQDILPFSDLPQLGPPEHISLHLILSLSYDDQLAVSRGDGKIALWNIRESPVLLRSFTGPVATDFCQVSFSIDGSYACYSAGCPQVILVRKDCSTLTLDDLRYNVSGVHFSNGAYIAIVSGSMIHNGNLQVEIWNIAGVKHLLQRLDISPPEFFLETNILSFNTDGSCLGFVTCADRGDQNHLQVMETVSGQIVEKIEIPTCDMLVLSYSKKTGHFRGQKLQLYPADRSMELFADSNISVDNDIVLCLPTEYYDAPFRINGNSITHLLSEDRISVLEIDAEEAIRDETTRVRPQ